MSSREVVAPFAQRGKVDCVSVQTVVEVATELVLLHHEFHVSIRSGDNANVCLDCFVASDALETLLLQDTQQLAL